VNQKSSSTMYDHTSQVKECMEEVTGRKAPDVFLVSADGELVGTHKLVLRLFSPVLRDLMSEPHTAVSHISLPASGSVLKHLVSMLTKGFTFAADREVVKSIGDVADVIALDVHWEVGIEEVDENIEEAAPPVEDSTESFLFDSEELVVEYREEDNRVEGANDSLLLGEWLDLSRIDPAINSDGAKFSCDECLRSFLIKSDLRVHKESAHGNDGRRGPGRSKKRLEDSYRGRRILKAEQTRNLRKEKEKEKQEKKMLWEKGLCRGPDGKIVSFQEVGKFGSSGSSLRGTQVCSYCGKSFNTKKALKNHEMVHSEKKSFKCDVCFKTFLTRGGLISHQKMHTDCKN